jgi:hypothetical protein
MASSDLAHELDALARDFAVGMGQQRSGASPRRRVEAAFLEPLRPSDLIGSGSTARRSSARKPSLFASKTPWFDALKPRIPVDFFTAALSRLRAPLQGLRFDSPLQKPDFSFRTVAGLMVAALIIVGAIFVWQSNGVSMTTSPAAEATASTFRDRAAMQNLPPQAAVVSQREASLANGTASLQLAQQLEAIARDLANLRRSVQQLTATQEQNTQTIATLQAMAGSQEPAAQDGASLQAVIENQKQMAEQIAALQAVDKDMKQKLSSLPLTQAAAPARPKKSSAVAPKQFAAQALAEESMAPVGLPFLERSQ